MDNLLNAPIKKTLTIADIDCEDLINKLIAMGLYPNAKVQVIENNKDNLQIACGTSRIGICSKLAAKIFVTH